MADGGMASGWQIIRVFGIAIRLHVSWLIIFALLSFSLATQILPLSNLADGGSWLRGAEIDREMAAFKNAYPGVSNQALLDHFGVTLWPTWQYWILGVIGALGLFVCVLAHELSHSIVARGSGIPVDGITLFVFGGVSRLRDEARTPAVEFKVAIVGPLMSVALAVGCYGINWAFHDVLPSQARALLTYFAWINAVLAIFNLLPGFPLDGGRVLRAVVWWISGSFHVATTVASACGMVFAAGLIAYGGLMMLLALFLPQQYGGNTGFIWMALIGVFLWVAARASRQQLAWREAFEGLTVLNAMRTDAAVVDADLTLDRFVEDWVFRHRAECFPVVDAGRFAGTVCLKDLQPIPRGEWPQRRIREAMQPADADETIGPDEPLEAAFRRLVEEGDAYLPVVADGRLEGIVTRQDILGLLQIRSDLGGRGHP